MSGSGGQVSYSPCISAVLSSLLPPQRYTHGLSTPSFLPTSSAEPIFPVPFLAYTFSCPFTGLMPNFASSFSISGNFPLLLLLQFCPLVAETGNTSLIRTTALLFLEQLASIPRRTQVLENLSTQRGSGELALSVAGWRSRYFCIRVTLSLSTPSMVCSLFSSMSFVHDREGSYSQGWHVSGIWLL